MYCIHLLLVFASVKGLTTGSGCEVAWHGICEGALQRLTQACVHLLQSLLQLLAGPAQTHARHKQTDREKYIHARLNRIIHNTNKTLQSVITMQSH